MKQGSPKFILSTLCILCSVSLVVAAQSKQRSGQVRPGASPVKRVESQTKTPTSPTIAQPQVNTEQPKQQPTISTANKDSAANLWNPFDSSTKELPPDFQGHSHSQLARILWDRRKQLKKDEFETTQQHQERVAKLHEQPLIGTLGEKSVFAFVEANPAEFSYDADTQTMTAVKKLIGYRSMLLENDDKNEYGDIPAATLESKIAGIDYYAGTNLFGAVVNVKQIESLRWAILIKNYKSFNSIDNKKPLGGHLGLSFQIPAVVARLIKSDLRLLYICRLVPPQIVVEWDHLKPTFNRPNEYDELTLNLPVELIEVRCINKLTGETLATSRPRDEGEEANHNEALAIDRCLTVLAKIPSRWSEGRTIYPNEFTTLRQSVESEIAESLAQIRDTKMRDAVRSALAEFSFADTVFHHQNFEPFTSSYVISKGYVKDRLISNYGLKPRGIGNIILLNDALTAVLSKSNVLISQVTEIALERKKQIALTSEQIPHLAPGGGNPIYAQLEGRWNLTFVGPSGSDSITVLVLRQDDTLAALLTARGQTVKSDSFDVKDKTFVLVCSSMENGRKVVLTLKGRVEGNLLSGKLTLDQAPGVEIPFTGVKK